VCSDVRVLSLRPADPAQGVTQWELRYAVSGEKFDLKKHACGTEVKAITYSAYKIAEENGRWDIYVIVDI
jgi:SHS2 domain-containing protein